VERLPEQLDPEKPDMVIPLGRGLTAKLYETVAHDNTKHVAVWFQQPASGQTKAQDFKCDLDRLEAVVDHGTTLRTRLQEHPGVLLGDINSRRPESVLVLGSWTARYFVQSDHANKNQIRVHVTQKTGPEGQEISQSFAADLRHLEETAKQAILFEHERGHERRWHAVVKFNSLENYEGYVRVEVDKWFNSEKKAIDFVSENAKSGYALYPEPFRRPRELANYCLSIREDRIPALGPDIRFHKAERERTGPGLLLGIWCQTGPKPHPGTHVKFDSGRDSVSREPTDYHVIPVGVHRPQGPGEQPISVVVEVDTKNWPPVHRIKEAIPDATLAKARFQELKSIALERHLKQLEQRLEQAIDLSREDMPPGHRR
jgi:hypothetical protein